MAKVSSKAKYLVYYGASRSSRTVHHTLSAAKAAAKRGLATTSQTKVTTRSGRGLLYCTKHPRTKKRICSRRYRNPDGLK